MMMLREASTVDGIEARCDRRSPATGGTAADGGERSLLDAVRAGDTEAYGALYEMHRASVHRLARRLTRDRDEADDVTSEVFCNMLRAIEGGGGPRDEAGAYLLRSVRNTIVKLRTRKDTGRATPMANEEFDQPSTDDDLGAITGGEGPATDALAGVSDHFQQVLWSVEVQGYDTAAVAAWERLEAPAAASLVYRARRALRRSYLRGSIRTPMAGRDCEPARALMPAFVDGDTATPGAARVRTHVATCAACRQALGELHDVQERLVGRSWLLLAVSAIRSFVGEGARAGAALIGAAPAAAAAVLSVGGLMVVAPEPRADELRAPAATTIPVAVAPPPAVDSTVADAGPAFRSVPDGVASSEDRRVSNVVGSTIGAAADPALGGDAGGSVLVPTAPVQEGPLGDVAGAIPDMVSGARDLVDGAVVVLDEVVDEIVSDVVDSTGTAVDSTVDVADRTTSSVVPVVDGVLGPVFDPPGRLGQAGSGTGSS